jgi:hypothetical protein
MKLTTYEATVENGQIRLSEPVCLPERTKVYIVVPESCQASSFGSGSL